MPELDPESQPLSRVELLRLAQGLGVVDADVMTRAELRAAIDKAQRPERPGLEHHPVTWVSVARRLLASVVERGLNLPDAAALIRGDTKLMAPPKAPPPVATVTLARIYAAQGHLDRAIGTLDEVLQSDPDHELARDLRGQLHQRRAELAERAGKERAAAGAEPTSAEPASAPLTNGAAGAGPLEPGPRAERGAGDEPARDVPSDEPVVASVDPAAELVAPSFDTLEREATREQALEARAGLEAPAGPEALADDAEAPADDAEPPASLTDPPTLAGVAPPVPSHWAGESSASAPSAAPEPSVDWQTANDAASTDVGAESGAPRWTAADSADADAGGDRRAWEAPPHEVSMARADRLQAADATAAVGQPESEAAPGAAHAADATAVAEAAVPDAAERAAVAGAVAEASEHTDAPAPAPDADAPVFDPACAPPSAIPPTLDGGAPELGLTPSDAGSASPDRALEGDGPRAEAFVAQSPANEGAALAAASTPAEPPAPAAPAGAQAALAEAASSETAFNEAAFNEAASDAATSSEAPNGVAPASIGATPTSAPGTAAIPASAPLPAPEELPRVPGLLLIETDSPIRYIYWELAGAGPATPHWIHVVSHTPTGRGGTERRERRIPVQRQLGALRLEGVPRQAVVRAKLTHAPDDARPLVVAGAVRPRSPGANEEFEVRYAPHAHAEPEALAGRARPLLERASPVYWD